MCELFCADRRPGPGHRPLANGQDPHMMVQCRSNPDRVWVQRHCSIYRSDDGARRWERITDVKPSVFGFGVAVHP